MGLENVPRCQHIKINGTQCGSPALRRRRLCFFHRRMLEQRARIAADQFAQRPFDVPVLEDANSIQMAIMQVMQLIALRRIEHKSASLLLYALQTASVNLRNTDFEVNDVNDVVIDRDTVHMTQINGPQWVEEDFDVEEESDRESEDADEEESDEDSEQEQEEEEQEQKEDEKNAMVPVAAAKPQQAMAASARKPVAREQSPLEKLKQLLATPENRTSPG